MRVAVIGQGYVGLPLALAAAAAGHTVLAVESDPNRLDSLARCHSYIVDVSDEDLREAAASGRFIPVTDLRGQPAADVYLIAVPTPITEADEPDFRFLDGALATVAGTAAPGALIVVESTVYPGAIRHHVAPLFEQLSGLQAGTDVRFAHSPERIDPGRDAQYTEIPKLVGGLDEQATAEARAFYETVFKHVVPVSSAEIAEFAKLFENTFRYLNIAFANELGRAAREMDVSFHEVVQAAASKPYGFMPFSHGPGVGGHCLPNNIHYLNHALRSVGRPSTLLSTAAQVNGAAPSYVVERLERSLERSGMTVEGATVLILGLAYKPGVADARNSPTYDISDALVARGARVRVVDPHVPEGAGAVSFTRAELTEMECADADAVLVVTDHEDFDYAMVFQNAPLILDCRGRFDSAKVEQL
ncbi:nucleotide sugar dehydrogenase [Streptomyces sp. CT34]|uniref:nucleotide sugar dehydrogenase n=1 Tax=Streptomyces sp. CT34 TaxID=1553907 RepID=UPI0005B76DE2|nr:nucleotide sugar dehydrogenase [Streptomyces sp. CT34]